MATNRKKTFDLTGIESDINKRWEKGIDHHPKSKEIMEFLSWFDWKYVNGYFDWRTGGDGDNGETLMYEMDVFFDMKDKAKNNEKEYKSWIDEELSSAAREVSSWPKWMQGDGVNVLTKEQIEELADQRAKELFGLSSRHEAFEKINNGEYRGTAAEAIMKNLKHLLEK